MTSLTLDQVDLENDVFAERIPHDTFALLRREAPVYWYDWSGGRGFWCVTKHEDVVAVSKDTKTFSSAQGANLEDLDEDARVARQSMLETDPPDHSRLRSLVGPPFTPRAVRAYEVALRELTREILDRALPLGEFDFVEEIARELPIRVLARLLGAPDSDTDALIGWGDRMIMNTDPEFTDVLHDSPESEAYRLVPFRSPAALELFEYGHAIAAERRADPRDDLVSKLVHTEIDGEMLSEREFDTMFLLLVVAGNETTRQAIAHGMLTLLEHPEEWARLRDEPRARLGLGCGRDPALDLAGAPLPPHGDAWTPSCAARRSARARRWSSGTSRRTSTRTSSTRRSASTSGATRIRTSRSAPAGRTSASARTWRGSRCRSCSRSSFRGSPRWS